MSQARCPASGSQAVLPRTSQPERRQAALPSMKVLEKLVTMQSSGCGRLPLLPSLPDSFKNWSTSATGILSCGLQSLVVASNRWSAVPCRIPAMVRHSRSVTVQW
ncbi:hypothetical protein PPTG_22965 [Phytophthora nicotianae INRA-310]|uniref:Uncharacterized protein n=2 Tax=Phytophthora nicotianae TaxID=4792 RepID=W2Q906_PHYN3|nr:hypothetical protein PPTG_22965 [Phytophthora nicotianae INRA-310]ETI46561.1 hypothetical protein F443_09052 [Phytophthora nicotianae P1569]ETN08750.1 hypothetical protein PPTG_22965 [Phytophthora nicotianae INRA-310]